MPPSFNKETMTLRQKRHICYLCGFTIRTYQIIDYHAGLKVHKECLNKKEKDEEE